MRGIIKGKYQQTKDDKAALLYIKFHNAVSLRQTSTKDFRKCHIIRERSGDNKTLYQIYRYLFPSTFDDVFNLQHPAMANGDKR